MKAKKFSNVMVPDIPPMDDRLDAEIPSAERVDTMASYDAANRAEISLRAAKEIRGRAKDDVLEGRRLVEVSPYQLHDPVGTDRIDFAAQDGKSAAEADIEQLMKSIERDGQQNPIIIRPRDPRWTPRSDDPANVEGVEFELLAGRRRTLAIQKLNAGRSPSEQLTVRARISHVTPDTPEGERRLHALHNRYLENAARKDLSAFQSAISGGELIWAYVEMGHSAEETESLLNISHSTRQMWQKAYRQQEAIREFFGSREPSFDELKKFCNGSLGQRGEPFPAPPEKVKGIRGSYTIKPARGPGQVAMSLRLTLNEVEDAELIQKLKEVIDQEKAAG